MFSVGLTTGRQEKVKTTTNFTRLFLSFFFAICANECARCRVGVGCGGGEERKMEGHVLK